MPWDADTQLLYEERVAIIMFDGGLDPAEAQLLARRCVEPPPPPPEQPGLFEPEYKKLLRDFYERCR